MTEKELTQELERLRRENERLSEENNHLKKRLRNAKDPTPLKRVSWRRLVEVAEQACLSIKRLGKSSKILVSLGQAQRVFKTLADAWAFLDQEEWLLEELFPPIQPKRHKQPACKFCGAFIQWAQGARGWLPFDSDGERHRCKRTAPVLAAANCSIPFGD